MDPVALVWIPGEGLTPQTFRKEDILGVRLLGDSPSVQVRGVSGTPTALFLSGRLSGSDGAWLVRLLDGWRSSTTAAPKSWDLPPLPEGARLSAEESRGMLRVQWGVRAGEFRRKCRALSYCLLGAGSVSMVLYLYSWSRSPGWSDVFALGVGGLVAGAFGGCSGRIRRLAGFGTRGALPGSRGARLRSRPAASGPREPPKSPPENGSLKLDAKKPFAWGRGLQEAAW